MHSCACGCGGYPLSVQVSSNGGENPIWYLKIYFPRFIRGHNTKINPNIMIGEDHPNWKGKDAICPRNKEVLKEYGRKRWLVRKKDTKQILLAKKRVAKWEEKHPGLNKKRAAVWFEKNKIHCRARANLNYLGISLREKSELVTQALGLYKINHEIKEAVNEQLKTK